MKKKLLIALLSLVTLTAGCLTAVACGEVQGKNEGNDNTNITDTSGGKTDDDKQVTQSHNLTLVQAKSATCTVAGNSIYYTCSHCNKWFADSNATTEITDHNSVVIAALGHDPQTHEAKAATCTEIGWNAYETCSRCDYTTYVEISALGHDTQTHEAKAATCT
jgi:protein-disulfide isomerase